MVVKEKRGRRRYVAFQTDRRVTDEQLLGALTSAFNPLKVKVPKVMQFDGTMGIVRCSPRDKDRVVEAMNGMGSGTFNVTTLSTSGTLRTLREKYFPPRAEEP